MTFLLDTNVVSEWTKQRPYPAVIAWLANVDEDRTFVSVGTIAELRFGVTRLPHGKHKRELQEWLELDIPQRFLDRIIPIDVEIAHAWGVVVARGRAAGRTMDTIDAFIGATAEVKDLTIVTRDVSDFKAIGIRVLNPWT
jgi:toxin FitB